jgi:hypothetical protein
MRAGVLLGQSERQAAAHCRDAMALPAARFPIWEAQESFLNCVKDYTDRWQPDGLGRVYLDASAGSAPVRPAAAESELRKWCQAVAAAVRHLGWQPTLGATGSKFGAAVAGRIAWQHSAPLVMPTAQRAFLASQATTNLPLDAEALLMLHHLGIRTLGQYARLPVSGVVARFGLAGRTAQLWAQGLDDRPVLPPWEFAEVSARIEFESIMEDRDLLLGALLQRAEKLLTPLRDHLQAVRRLLLNVTRADGHAIPVSHAFALPTAAREPVRLALEGLLDSVAWEGQSAAEMTLTLAGITDAPSIQLTLFAPQDAGRARLTALLERLAGRFGADAFRQASLTDPGHLLLERRATFQPWLTWPVASEQA